MAPSFELRPASKADFEFCWPIYCEAIQPLMTVDWREPDQRRIVERALADAGSSILRSEKSDAGWLHMTENRQIILLKQFHLLPVMRNRGLGSSFLGWMKERAERKRKDLNAELPTNSPARHLLERMGFKAVSTSGSTLTMRY